jgi:1,4-alpha-glucan branching enzyme
MTRKIANVSESIPRQELDRLLHTNHHHPGSILGRHGHGDGKTVTARCLVPGALEVTLIETGEAMQRHGETDLFQWSGPAERLPKHFRIRWLDRAGNSHLRYEPYAFPPLIGDFDLHIFHEGRHQQAYRILGANLTSVDGIEGVHFATWAPNASRVSVVGDFNAWDGRWHPMNVRGSTGIWEIFIPGIEPGNRYKFEIRNRDAGAILLKADPYGRAFEMRPANASIVPAASRWHWRDGDWLDRRARRDWLHEPMTIYELHLGSWRRAGDGGFLNYRELAGQLVPYLAELGFTHVELLPVTEHPLDASWGYQTTGFFAPTSRFGGADDFRYFVDLCHCHNIGVILDWVAGHFPKDDHALARYDGTPLYEHDDPRRGEHRDWGTLIFNYSRNEVRDFLISNAFYWVDEFHLDGLRVDAVASMLYLDYSRKAGEWLPNPYGGNENLEAIDFLRDLNSRLLGTYPGVVTIAEESTAWPQVTRPPWVGGLGFSMKWNMGWMHDTLMYLTKDPIHRLYHHEQLTFGLLYAFHENFILPFSHDEVVHGKGSMLRKMPGDEWQRFANLRLLYTYMYTYPGKKLLFMGNELAQWNEWSSDSPLNWELLGIMAHAQIRDLIAALNRLYVERAPLHQYDFKQEGFEWIDCHDASQSVLSYLRRGDSAVLVIVLNFTPVPRHDYRLGVPASGYYRELFNSDSRFYGGGDIGNSDGVQSTTIPWMGRQDSITLKLPPLGGLILEWAP